MEGLEQRERNIGNKEKEADAVRNQLEEVKKKQIPQLEKISAMSTAEAKQALLDTLETEIRHETSRRLREWETKLKEESDKKAQDILAQAIQRCASEVVAAALDIAVVLGVEAVGLLLSTNIAKEK
jgi:ribonuclease Y